MREALLRQRFTQAITQRFYAPAEAYRPQVRTRGSHVRFAPSYAMLARTWLVVTRAVTTDGDQIERLPSARFPLWFPPKADVLTGNLPFVSTTPSRRIKVLGGLYAIFATKGLPGAHTRKEGRYELDSPRSR